MVGDGDNDVLLTFYKMVLFWIYEALCYVLQYVCEYPFYFH